MPTPPDPRVVAVVVTFNRLALVQRLVGALAGTPGLAEVVVVDNASSDGTGEWLRGFETGARAPSSTSKHQKPPHPTPGGGDAPGSTRIRPVLLEENSGGAGGFAEGMRVALERDADLVWLMDDDGLPDPGCLERLLEEKELDFWGPVVVDETDPNRLVFPIRLPGGTRVVHDLDDVRAAAVDGRLDDIVIPFNGVLVTRELAGRIGVPRAEFFIWGDDHEYRLRAEAAGARIATVVDAVVTHPSVGELGTPLMFGRTTYNHSPSELKHYCMARNNTVNLRDYRGWLHVLAFFLKTLWFYSFTRPSAHRLALSVKAATAGLRGDFTGHRRYLR